jgi:hypothetical protein
MAGYVHGKPGHDQPRKILARNPEREVGAFLSVLLGLRNPVHGNAAPAPHRPAHGSRHRRAARPQKDQQMVS